MGEKVYVTSGSPIDPPKQSAPREPLNYAGPFVPRRFSERLMAIVRALGGPAQIMFAIGLGLVVHGFTSGRLGGDVGFVGGVMIGLVLRVPLRQDW